jgi:predicted PurR-regulated permease PerM
MKISSLDQSEKLAGILSVILMLVAVTVLYFGREIFIPLALALLFSFLLAPVVTRLEKLRIPRAAAAFAAVLVALAVVLGIASLVGGQLVELTYKLPDYQANISHRIASLKAGDNSPLSRAADTLDIFQKQLSETFPKAGEKPSGPALTPENEPAIVPVQIIEPETNIAKFAQSIFGPLLGPIGTAAVVVVFVLFMLIKREDLRDRIIRLFGRGRISTTTEALDEASAKVTGYLQMQLVVNTVFGIAVGTGLYFIGVPHAFLWGLLAIVLRFIPYLGAWIALGFPLILSLAATDSWTAPILTISLFAGIELITSNVLEPWLYGAHTGLSPVAVMAATIFWTWLWGGVGLLLALPLTVCVSILGKYIPALGFLEAILGDEPTLSSQERYYQRLLAMDGREATQVAKEYLKTHSVLELYSEVFVPALAAAEREDHKGTLDERRQRFIFETTRELVEEFGTDLFIAEHAKAASNTKTSSTEDSLLPSENEKPEKSRLNETIFCLPAADAADEIAAIMLAQLLEQEGYQAESVSFKTLAHEVVDQVGEARSHAVCISATPPHDTLHTRYLCKLLRARFPKLNIVVGLWDADGSEEKLAQRQARLMADKVVVKLDEAMRQLRPFGALDSRPADTNEP